jgi:hypothetical protein
LGWKGIWNTSVSFIKTWELGQYEIQATNLYAASFR